MNYDPRSPIPARHAAHLHDAYTAAGLTPPASTVAVDELIATEPTPTEVAEHLALEHATTSDPHQFLEEAVDKIRRAAAIHELRLAISKYRTKAAKTTMADRIAQAVTDLNKPFTKTVKQLTTAATSLPSLDLDAVVAADQTAALKQAEHALQTLGAFAGIYPSPRFGSVPVKATAALRIVDIPDVQPEEVNRMTDNPHPSQDDPVRDAVRKFLRDADQDLDATLVAAARGDYEPVSFALAASTTDLAARIRRAENALRRIRTDGPPFRDPSHRPMRIRTDAA